MLITGREDLGSGTKSFVPQPRHFQTRQGVFEQKKWLYTGSTANATPAALTPDPENEPLDANSAYAFEGLVVAGVSGGGNAQAYRVQGCVKKGAANANTALVGSPLVTAYENDAGADLGITADTTNGRLILTATGVAATNINWRAELSFIKVA